MLGTAASALSEHAASRLGAAISGLGGAISGLGAAISGLGAVISGLTRSFKAILAWSFQRYWRLQSSYNSADV